MMTPRHFALTTAALILAVHVQAGLPDDWLQSYSIDLAEPPRACVPCAAITPESPRQTTPSSPRLIERERRERDARTDRFRKRLIDSRIAGAEERYGASSARSAPPSLTGPAWVFTSIGLSSATPVGAAERMATILSATGKLGEMDTRHLWDQAAAALEGIPTTIIVTSTLPAHAEWYALVQAIKRAADEFNSAETARAQAAEGEVSSQEHDDARVAQINAIERKRKALERMSGAAARLAPAFVKESTEE